MDGVQRYVSRPEQVEAVRVTDDESNDLAVRQFGYHVPPHRRPRWVVRGSDRRVGSLDDDEFQRRYVPEDEPGGVS